MPSVKFCRVEGCRRPMYLLQGLYWCLNCDGGLSLEQREATRTFGEEGLEMYLKAQEEQETT